MKKIGITSSGTVIVEMAAVHYAALTNTLPTPKVASKTLTTPPKQNSSPAGFSFAQKVDYVKSRILKLKPKRKDRLSHAIAAMFQFAGGIPEKEIQKIVETLKKQRVVTVDPKGKVQYQQG